MKLILYNCLKVKHGAENMLQSLANSGHSRDKKLIGEAQQMLADSKAKIEYLKMRILKVKQNKANASRAGSDTSSNGESNNRGNIILTGTENQKFPSYLLYCPIVCIQVKHIKSIFCLIFLFVTLKISFY